MMAQNLSLCYDRNNNDLLFRHKKKGRFWYMTNNNKRPTSTKTSLIIRLVAGMYLVYLAYELFMGMNEAQGAPVAVSIGAAAVFLIFGIFLVIVNGRDFLKGNFQGGIMDVSEEDKTVDNE